MQRYFIEQELKQEVLIINQEIIHHINRVMRNQIGEQIVLVANNQQSFIYQILKITNQNILVKKIIELPTNELDFEMTLCAPFLKKENLELVLQKTCEIGVCELIVANYQYGVSVVSSEKFKKKKKISKNYEIGCTAISEKFDS